MTKKILIADDHPLVREGIKHVLEKIDDEQLILQASNFSDAEKITNQENDFDLILLDLNMPQMNGVASLIKLRQQLPSTPIVIISASDDISDIRGAINNGANGYIHKSSSNEVMLNALLLVLSGGLYLPPQWNVSTEKNITPLTHRQKQVVALLAVGKANKEIAKEFSISDKTVKAHLSEIFKRLEVSNRTQAVHQARQLGVLTGY
ncbi:Two-component transcriptional response regulator, LuxR family [hydrothermal vent metagenome]|uniref:Two-component transcriptional response regulator, LuxR family n=1 Tax=hydrothermal vent metagenome TaxID=652676 RepID=A0A3B0Y5J0_9ZZZZ